MIYILFLFLSLLNARLVDDFSDGNITLDPVWLGDLEAFSVIENSTSGANSTGVYSLRLNAPSDGSISQYISMAPGSWSGSLEWGAWIGRRSGSTFTTSNKVLYYLWSSSSNLEAEDLNAYRIEIGDNSGNDEIRLVRVDNGTPTIILEGEHALENGISDISFLLRITKSSSGVFNIYTSEIPSSGGGSPPSLSPNSTNTNVFQGSVTDDVYDFSGGGNLGFQILHTSSVAARSAVEIDQVWFESNTDQSLPVFLSFFEAKESSDGIYLQWITESEIDNLGFELEKVINGNRKIIASYLYNANLSGAGSSTERNYYNYLDNEHFSGGAFYNLYQIDFSGKSKLVSTADIKQRKKLASDAFIFPNPSSGIVKINLGEMAFNGKIQVYNILGQEVYSTTLTSGSGTNFAFLQFKNILTPGVYIARVRGENYSKSQRFIFMP